MARSNSDVGRVKFDLGDALRLGYEQVKRRRGRSLINVASVALGVSFLTTLLFNDSMNRALVLSGGVSFQVEQYQFLLMFAALAVSVISIANAMLITVYERFREIGTLKCLGALDKHILMLFLVESIIQGIAGGFIGVSLGLSASAITAGVTTGVKALWIVPPAEVAGILVGCFLLSVLLSVSAALYPAYKAARLSPVEAIRYEF